MSEPTNDRFTEDKIIDPSERWLRLCRLVLGIYRFLKVFVGSKRALAIITAILSRKFRKQSQEYMSMRFGISQRNPGQAFDQIAENYKSLGEKTMGSNFIYREALKSEMQSHIHIERCLFNDFFREHGAPEAVAIFCALDSVWADELHKPQYRTRFTRPTTLAGGDDACRFEFTRDH